jgi:hypothetical protein
VGSAPAYAVWAASTRSPTAHTEGLESSDVREE